MVVHGRSGSYSKNYRTNMNYNNALRKSTLREELEDMHFNRTLQKLQPFLLLGVLVWGAWMFQMINGLTYLAGKITVHI